MPDKQLNEVSPMLREQYERGRAAMQHANWDYAISIFTQVLRQEPGLWQCRAALRECQAKSAANGCHPLRHFLAWATHCPRLALGRLALRRRPLYAIRAADWVLVREPASGSALRLLGEAALKADFPITAAQVLEMVYKRAPQNKRVALWFGEALVRAGQVTKAEAVYRRLAQVFPADPVIEKALKDVTALRAMAEAGTEVPGGGQQFDRASLKEHPEIKAGEEPAEAGTTSEENLPSQISRAEQHVAQYPTDLALRFELGALYHSAGRLSDAIREFQRAAAHPHLRIKALHHLGECFASRKMDDLAARTFQKAIQEKAAFDDQKKELVYLLGSVLERMGKQEEAIAQFRQIYEVDIGFRDVARKIDSYYAHGSPSVETFSLLRSPHHRRHPNPHPSPLPSDGRGCPKGG
jgi:tetratricopeptide (TPR) repeat protein